MKNIINVYGKNFTVDESTQKLISYNNKAKQIVYNAEVVENGKNTGFYTDYIENGTVEEIEERLKMWDNPVRLIYAFLVDFDSTKNDPDKKIWNDCVEYVKNHESEFFTKGGDWKHRIQAAKNEMRLKIVENL